MAERYGKLPTEIMEQATTIDLSVFNSSNTIKYREEKSKKGESIADTFSQTQVDDMYTKFKEKHKNGNEDKQ